MVKKKVSKKKANKSSNNFNRNLLIGAVIIILIFVVAFNFAGKGSDEEGLEIKLTFMVGDLMRLI